MRVTFVWTLAVAGIVGTGTAQRDPLRDEIILRIEEARRFEFPERSEFIIESLFAVDPVPQDEMERLRRLAPTDRTSAYHLERIRLEEEHGGSRRRTALYIGDDQAWRVNDTRLTEPGPPFADSARGGDEYWIYSQDQLQFTKGLDSLPSDIQFDPEMWRNAMRLVVKTLVTGIAGIEGGHVEISEIERSADGAKVTARGEERTLLIEGTFEQAASGNKTEFQINRVHVLDRDGNPVATNEYGDWRYYPELKIRLAHHRVTTLASGKRFSEYRVTHAGPLSHNIAEITQTPRPDGKDVFRGPATYRSVIDHSQGLRSIFDAETGSIISRESTRSSYSAKTRLILGTLITLVAFATFAAVRKGRPTS